MEPGDPFEHEDVPAFRPPPPPDDRLWRHPSELVWSAPRPATRSQWPTSMASGIAGAVATVALLAVTGVVGDTEAPREAIVREAVQSASFTTDTDGVADMVGEVGPAIVRLDVSGEEEAVGSGVLFRTDGHVLTNAHVVDDASRVVAVLADGTSVTAKVVGFDADTDIAVVKLDGDGPWPTALLGSADGLAVGEPAVAMGSPLGLRGSSSVTMGVISATGREIEPPKGPVLYDMIQTDAAIAAGSSGGALLDASGAVVGITTAFAVTDMGNGGLGFATPVDVARAVAEDLLAVGHVRRAWFGVKGDSAIDGGGVLVVEAPAAGPAAQAGLRPGDIVRRLDTRPVATMSALRVALRRLHPGDRVSVVFDRDGKRRTAVVVLEERIRS